jgi:hypothetical protein
VGGLDGADVGRVVGSAVGKWVGADEGVGGPVTVTTPADPFDASLLLALMYSYVPDADKTAMGSKCMCVCVCVCVCVRVCVCVTERERERMKESGRK